MYGTCCQTLGPYQNVLLSDATKRFWYDALLVSVDKPYTTSSRWGATIAYTYAESDQTGNDTFSLDCLASECLRKIEDYPRHPTASDERNRLVFSGIVGLPWEIRFSTLITIGSGLPFTINDNSAGFGPNEHRTRLYEGRQEGSFPFDAPYQSWDFRLQKDFLIANLVSVGVIGEELIARVGLDATDMALQRPGSRLFDFTGRPMRVGSHRCPRWGDRTGHGRPAARQRPHGPGRLHYSGGGAAARLP